MPSNWSKGFTKENHPAIRKRSLTMKRNKVDNFALWRERMRKAGKFGSFEPLEKNGDLAELIGVILGDGHLRKFPRTEELSIFSNSNNPGFIKRYSRLVEKIFGKKPACTKHGKSNCTRIRIYQKGIKKKLDIPYSPRRWLVIKIPKWILANNQYIVRYLRGLYEAEGCYCVHEKTSTYKVFFSNRNDSMLGNVFFLVKKLGFYPNRSGHKVQISRKNEVYEFLDLIKFRKY